MYESIFKASLRLFFKTFSVIAGLALGILVMGGAVGSFGDTESGVPEITYRYTPQIVPNGAFERKSFSSKEPVILKINITSEIGTEFLNKKTIENILMESRERAFKDGSVKGIILNINTPGGGAIDSNAIYQTLKGYKERYKTPIYAYVDGLCASGGMYIACAADKIYSSDASLFGSVGVLIGPFMNVYKLMGKVGIESKTITAGKDKDEMNPMREWKTDEGANFKELSDHFYEQFVAIVVQNRPSLTKQKLTEEYGAKLFSASTAEQHGFVDGSNHTFGQTLDLLAAEAGIKDQSYQVVEFESNNWLASIFKNKLGLGLLNGEVKHSLDLPPQLNPEFMNQPMYLYRPN